MRTALIRLAALAAALTAYPASAAPSTFGPVVGSALLCRDAIDNAYFHAYFSKAFGPAYKQEGGAFWFRADGTLWGATVSEVMVADGSSEARFIGAVTDSTPEELNDAIRQRAGVKHRKTGASRYAVLESGPGSRIAYSNNKAKIYCARMVQQPPGP